MKTDNKTKIENQINKKLKKNALEFVNFQKEKLNDPKYKTELCKSWLDTNFCKYANKCRFAHGRQELSFKETIGCKYKIKECLSFKNNGYCMYGIRCNFMHDERKLENIDRSYFNYYLGSFRFPKCYNSRRLEVFSRFIQARTADCSPISYRRMN
jgi:hypothetical protein